MKTANTKSYVYQGALQGKDMARIALVHDWFDCIAGSEKVVREMVHCFPGCDAFSLVDHLSDEEKRSLGLNSIETSFIQSLPFAKKRFRNYLPLMPVAIEQFDLSEYDVILSSSHAFGKAAVTSAEQLHISYVHTPIRYAWDMQHEYLKRRGLTRGAKAAFVRLVLHYLRMWDQSTANRPDAYIANSNYVARRIKKTYERDASVIYPPVDLEWFKTHHKKEPFYLAAGRLVSYKRFDLLVDAFEKLPDQRLVLIGDGPEFKKLKSRAPSNVEMLGYQENEVLRDYMKRAKAFVFAAVEDFGIMPVEAQACGTPVVGMGRGGLRETVVENETGLFFDEQTPESVADAINTFEELPTDFFDPDHIRKNAERFSIQRFRDEFISFVAAETERHFGTVETDAASHDPLQLQTANG